MSRAAVLLLAFALALPACKKHVGVGDRVLVEWEGQSYPAIILEAPSPSKFKVHYEGYDSVWDEVVVKDRVKGLVEGPVVAPEPPQKVRDKAIQAATKNLYKIGDHVRVDWHGQMYPATIVGIVGQEKYRVHYEGYGTEWDETVGLARIQAR